MLCTAHHLAFQFLQREMDALRTENEALKTNLLSDQFLEYLESTARAKKSLRPELETLILRSSVIEEEGTTNAAVEDTVDSLNNGNAGTVIRNIGTSEGSSGKII